MAASMQLPKPNLNARLFGARCIPALTDNELYVQTGVRLAFTGRDGGVSKGPYATLNLGSHVSDDPQAVATNRSVLLEALDATDVELVVPNQVHGDTVLSISSSSTEALAAVRECAEAGADALLVEQPDIAALLCFADCVPVIAVSPSGRFAVVHAGWRGVIGNIAPKAVRLLAEADARSGYVSKPKEFNIYVGPHIKVECFETGSDVRDRFAAEFGQACIAAPSHVDLLEALIIGLERVGIVRERIACAQACTVCEHDAYFSYRASGGICGRNGALAFRRTR